MLDSLLKNLRRTENGPGWPISTRSKFNGIPDTACILLEPIWTSRTPFSARAVFSTGCRVSNRGDRRGPRISTGIAVCTPGMEAVLRGKRSTSRIIHEPPATTPYATTIALSDSGRFHRTEDENTSEISKRPARRHRPPPFESLEAASMLLDVEPAARGAQFSPPRPRVR